MKNLSLILAGVAVLPATGIAQNLAEPKTAQHHIGVGLPVWLKATGKFTAARATDPGAAAGSAVNRRYDDGFNGVDSTGNAAAGAGVNNFARTSFFGYASDVQVNNVIGAGTLDLHSVALNGGDYTRNLENKPQFPGVEFFYRYDWKSGPEWRASWELGAAYNYFNWSQNGDPNSTVNLLTDVFQLGAVTLFPGGAPYTGPVTALPGSPIIGSTPTRTETTAAAAVTGERKLELHALQFRVGPVLDWVPNEKWSIGVQGGLALGVGWSQLNFAEQITVTAPNIAAINQSGRTSDVHAWAGWFSALRVTRQIDANWNAHVEMRHMWTESLQHNGAQRSGEIRLSDGVGFGAGVSYKF